MHEGITLPGPIATWNGLDWLLAGIVILSTLRALMRGFLRALFSLLGFLCAFALASQENAPAAQWVMQHGWITQQDRARVVCYIAMVVAVLVLAGIAGAMAKRTAHSLGLGLVDRLLGAGLGIVRGVLIGAAIVLIAQAIAPRAELLLQSQLTSCFLAAGHAVSFVVPHTLR